MAMKKCFPFAVLVLALWPACASASESQMVGLLTVITMMLVVAPLTLIHLLVLMVLALYRVYRSKQAALWHSLIATLAPIIGLAAAVIELGNPRHVNDLLVVLLILLVVLALSWLPMAIHYFGRPADAGELGDPGSGA
jgi:hypothetical protein